MPRKKKRALRKLSKNVAGNRLLEAVGRFIEAHGGKALVAGGIQIEQHPGDHEFTFRVSVKVTGKAPPPSEEHSLER